MMKRTECDASRMFSEVSKSLLCMPSSSVGAKWSNGPGWMVGRMGPKGGRMWVMSLENWVDGEMMNKYIVGIKHFAHCVGTNKNLYGGPYRSLVDFTFSL